MSDSDARDNHSDSSSRDSILKSSRLNAPIRSSVLRPSLFTTTLSNNDNSLDKAASANNLVEDSTSNPFLKDETESKSNQQDENKTDEEKLKDKPSDKDVKTDPLALLSKNGLQRSNLFTATKNSIPRVEQTGYVFGQNVHERVAGAMENVQSSSKQNNEADKKSENDNELSNAGATGLLFSSAIQSKIPDEGITPKENENKSLTEVAREYEESRAQKRKYEEVETFTGEENETNILDINCKLFAFVNRNWEERGRGSLRLNDSKEENGCSRVVFRTSGNLRLLVNTKVWKGMVAERSSQKSLRLTAMDNNGQIKVFLIMSRPDDISTLYKLLTKRINECKDVEDIANENTSSNGENEKKNVDEDKKDVNELSKEDNENSKIEESKEEQEMKDNKTADEGDDNNEYEPSPKKQSIVDEN